MTFSVIDLSKLPKPDVVEVISLADIIQFHKDYLINLDPSLEAVLALESEPLTKFVENAAYRETILRARVNVGAWAVMIAHTSGADLDNLAAIIPLDRLVITPADTNAVPPIAAVMESDEDFRLRVRLAPTAFSSAGPATAYIFHGLSADSNVKDVSATSPAAMQVTVTVLSRIDDGAPNQALLDAVTAALNDDVVPDTDQVTVQAAAITDYTIDATLTLYPGPDPVTIMAAANAAIQTYVDDHHKLGHDITLSGIYSALHQDGVQKVTLTSPVADIVITGTQAAHCGTLTVTQGGNDV